MYRERERDKEKERERERIKYHYIFRYRLFPTQDSGNDDRESGRILDR